jgi:hypothetical protein
LTCPESEQLEEVELDVDVLGLLVTSCSAFEPSWAVSCARTCARKLDRCRRDACQARVGAVLELRSCLRRR